MSKMKKKIAHGYNEDNFDEIDCGDDDDDYDYNDDDYDDGSDDGCRMC